MKALSTHYEAVFATSLFLGYALLWFAKRRSMKHKYGVDPHVMANSPSSLQVYFGALTKVLTAYLVVIIPVHGVGLQWHGLFARFSLFELPIFDLIGFGVGLLGLGLCGYAQVKMGRSWRVGMDPNRKEPLVTTGLYRFIHNPTYTGLMLVCLGLWLIWPTATVAAFVVVFVFFLEVQTRCEEDFLAGLHGGIYRGYVLKTKRFIPFIY